MRTSKASRDSFDGDHHGVFCVTCGIKIGLECGQCEISHGELSSDDRLGAAVQMIDLAPMDAYQFPGLVTDEDRRRLNDARDEVAAVRAAMRLRR